MEEQEVKGNYVASVAKYVERSFDAATAAKIREGLSPDVVRALPGVKTSNWYPIHYVTDFVRGMEKVTVDLAKTEEHAIACGFAVADEATTTFLKLLIKVLSPAMFARQFPAFWRRYHNFGDCSYDVSRIQENRASFTVPGYEYLHWIGAGWIQCVFKALGKKDIRVTSNCPADARIVPRVQWDVAWR